MKQDILCNADPEPLLEALLFARRERDDLMAAIRQTLEENKHLADGDDCTLKVLKDAFAKAEFEDKLKGGDH